jgi:hypothetical protein
MAMPRKPGPKKRQVLIRLQETTANALETQAIEKGYRSLPSHLADRIEQQHLNKTKSADAQ